METWAEQFLRVLQSGTVSTNINLRLNNLALDLNWLPYPVLLKSRWPAVHHKEKRAVTSQEHERILAREPNTELRAFYDCCWHLGRSQSDVARLKAADVD